MKGNAMRCRRGREQGKQLVEQEREQEEEHREKQERHAGEVVEGAAGQAAAGGEAAAPRPGSGFAQRISNSLNALISLINAAILASHGRVPVHIAA